MYNKHNPIDHYRYRYRYHLPIRMNLRKDFIVLDLTRRWRKVLQGFSKKRKKKSQYPPLRDSDRRQVIGEKGQVKGDVLPNLPNILTTPPPSVE